MDGQDNMKSVLIEEPNYFNYMPEELIFQVLIYLDMKDIERLTLKSSPIEITQNILKKNFFWIQKLKHDNMESYIPFFNIHMNLSHKFLNFYEFRTIKKTYIM